MRDFRKFCRPKIVKNPLFGDVIVQLKTGELVAISNYKDVGKFFKKVEVVGESNAVGNIMVHNSKTNEDKVVVFDYWLELSDDWELTGLLGITTYSEDNASNGDYVILANGHTLIISPSDYSKVSDNWELVDTISKLDYVEIGGVKWATMNVGANSITDTGLYFQWGDTQGYTASQVGSGEGKKAFTWNDYKYTNDGSYTKYNEGDGKITLEPTDDAVKAAWGGNWRMPTVSEFIALGEAVDTEWTADYQGSGVAGLVCTDKTDSSKVLFFPAVGYAYDGVVYNVGSDGGYWSGSLNTDDYDGINAYCLFLASNGSYWDGSYYRYGGYTVRGVLDE